jgi:hypothetical protein
MNKFLSVLIFFTLLIVSNANAQTQKDTIFTNFSETPVIVDGSDADACWAAATWHAIDQVWIPYNAKMVAGDFEGRYKVAWDANYLYILVEVKDDMLSDDHSNPLQNWWDDDAVELFIDENRSKGDHERNNNAFAYHVSLTYDAIDQNSSGAGVNYKNNMTVKMDTIGQDTYLWEFAVKMYSASFNISNPEASRVKLTPDKLMGFTIAYCDNDAGTTRENFIGSMIMTQPTANDNYKTANYFGSMLLVDSDQDYVSAKTFSNQEKRVSVFPNPATDKITLTQSVGKETGMKLEIRSMTGVLIKTVQILNGRQTVEIGDLAKGLYLFSITSENYSQTELIDKR